MSLLEFELQLQQLEHIHPHTVINKRTKQAVRSKSWFPVQPKHETFSKNTIFLNTVNANLGIGVNNLTAWCSGRTVGGKVWNIRNRYKLFHSFYSCDPLNCFWKIKNQSRTYTTDKRNQFKNVMKQIKGSKTIGKNQIRFVLGLQDQSNQKENSSTENNCMLSLLIE